jgi:serine/threonine-protein kinase RsbW
MGSAALRGVSALRSSGPPDMLLGLQSRAENVALVRQALTGLGAAVQLDGAVLADVKTAVSEACNNVVVHAYGGRAGPMEVYVRPNGHELVVVVRDDGEGIHPRPVEPDAPMQGVGLSLIQALTKSVEFGGGLSEGTEVRMVFEAPGDVDPGGVETIDGTEPIPSPPPPGDVTLSVCGLLVGPVLSSVVAMVAARSGFSVERLSDAQILSDTIAAHAPAAFPSRHVQVGIDAENGELLMRVGPLVTDGAEALVRASGVAGLEPLLERLPDELGVERPGGAEELLVRLRDPG